MKQIFVNLPVKDLKRSKDFWANLGFGFDARFTDDKAACLVIEKDHIHAMLLTEPFFQTFLTGRAIADAKKSTEVLIALSCSSDEEVKDFVAKASKAGGRPFRDPRDHGFMYEHAFEDPDGHVWELFHMREMPK
ncbi:MAG TPA: VOC family protein [Burkholderiales bacterium]|nr:VOC family protein [Burkholderiales bacterium]